MEQSFASRVLEFRKFKGLSQQAFAERCGLEQGNVSQMEKGTEPKQSNVTKLVAGFPDLNPDWLLLGTGPMLRDGRTLTAVPVEEPTTKLRRNREGEDGSYWEQIAIERAETIELLKQLLTPQFPGLAEAPGKSVYGEYAAVALSPEVGFQQAGRRAPTMFVATTGHRLAWVDEVLDQPLTVEHYLLKKTA